MPDVSLLSGAGERNARLLRHFSTFLLEDKITSDGKLFCVLELFSFAHVGRLDGLKVLFAICYVLAFET